VCDLGCGTGMLSIACVLMGASHVLSVDVDKDALEVMQSNVSAAFDGEDELATKVEMVCENVFEFKREATFDVVVMNPPFGTRDKGADMAFLKTAASLGKVIYSMHKTSTRKHVDKAGKALQLDGKPIAQLRYNLDNTYDHHKKKSVNIDVDLWRFQSK
jgi:predicted RNA methylase